MYILALHEFSILRLFDSLKIASESQISMSGLFFVLFNLEMLVKFNFSQNSRTRTTPIAGHLTVVSACSGRHLPNYFFKSQIPRGLPRGGPDRGWI